MTQCVDGRRRPPRSKTLWRLPDPGHSEKKRRSRVSRHRHGNFRRDSSLGKSGRHLRRPRRRGVPRCLSEAVSQRFLHARRYGRPLQHRFGIEIPRRAGHFECGGLASVSRHRRSHRAILGKHSRELVACLQKFRCCAIGCSPRLGRVTKIANRQAGASERKQRA